MPLRKPHPCWDWCQNSIRGIVANKKLTGDISQDFEVKIWSIRSFMLIPPYTTVLKCRHGRSYGIRQTKESYESMKGREAG